jgi:hypothetical protein
MYDAHCDAEHRNDELRAHGHHRAREAPHILFTSTAYRGPDVVREHDRDEQEGKEKRCSSDPTTSLESSQPKHVQLEPFIQNSTGTFYEQTARVLKLSNAGSPEARSWRGGLIRGEWAIQSVKLSHSPVRCSPHQSNGQQAKCGDY